MVSNPDVAARLYSLYERNPDMFRGSIFDDSALQLYNIGQDQEDDVVAWDHCAEGDTLVGGNCLSQQPRSSQGDDFEILSMLGMEPIVVLRSFGHCCKKWGEDEHADGW